MPGAIVAIGSIIAGAASAVAAVVVPIVATVAAIIAPVVATVTTIVGALISTISSIIGPIISTIGTIGEWVVTSVGQSVSGLVKAVADAAQPFVKGLADAISSIAGAIDEAAAPILEPIKAGLEIVKGAVDQVVTWVNTAFHPSAQLDALKAAHPDLWAMSEGYNSTFITLLEGDGLITATQASLLALPDVIGTINQVATLKILGDLVQGHASVSELLGKIAEGKGFETAQAIAILSKSIISNSVGLMDRVDTELGILNKAITTFDVRLKESLDLYAEQTKTEILGLVTPSVDTLGTYQLEINRRLAAVVRHIDDDVWFSIMLAKVLP